VDRQEIDQNRSVGSLSKFGDSSYLMATRGGELVGLAAARERPARS
jgi:hypothetical protein